MVTRENAAEGVEYSSIVHSVGIWAISREIEVFRPRFQGCPLAL